VRAAGPAAANVVRREGAVARRVDE
jgi:hypothetical protein